MKIRPMEAVLFHTEGWADRHYEAHFSQFYERVQKKSHFCKQQPHNLFIFYPPCIYASCSVAINTDYFP